MPSVMRTKELFSSLKARAATLTTYAQVPAVVVSYLQAKRVWTPTAAYAAGSTARRDRDPDAMEIGRVDDRQKKGKGKGGDEGMARRRERVNEMKEKAVAPRKTRRKSVPSAGDSTPHRIAGIQRQRARKAGQRQGQRWRWSCPGSCRRWSLDDSH